jgi:acetyl esterase/lipase
MALKDDPRADPRLIALMEPLGLADAHQPLPFSHESPLSEIIDFITTIEEGLELLFSAIFSELPSVEGVVSTSETIQGVDGNDIELFLHRPAESNGPLPGILHLHGGGMVLLGADGPGYVRWREELAATGLVVVGVQFRNGAGRLGTHPFPAGLNDCISALHWMHEQRERLGLSKIIVSGESGGGNLSIATTLSAKREGRLNEIDGVYAQCPYISNAYATPLPELTSLYENNGYFLGEELMALMAQMYDPSGLHATDVLAWPYYASVDELRGLPPHVISVNELDPLRDEGLAHYRKLIRAGVSASARTVNGTSHAGDCIFRTAIPESYESTIRDINSFAWSL